MPRILAPIVRCIERLPLLTQDGAFHQYVKDEWGSIANLKLQILSDFFKHGFDGSGDDGGSCIGAWVGSVKLLWVVVCERKSRGMRVCVL